MLIHDTFVPDVWHVIHKQKKHLIEKKRKTHDEYEEHAFLYNIQSFHLISILHIRARSLSSCNTQTKKIRIM